MSYGYSSTYPRVPNSTPQLPTSIRPPIHNPYDKFTQPQFDEWIGGITSALRKALGQEEEETPTSQATKPRQEDAHHVSDTDEDNVEDSFAEWKATRAKEKGKMRATEDEQGSEYGGSQESYEDSDVQDHAVGNTPSDAIELLSDEGDAEGEEVNDPGERDGDGGLIEGLSPVESDGEVQQPYVGGSQPAMPSEPRKFFASITSQEAIEISDGETEDHDQGDGSLDAETALFGWGEEGGEDQQPPDIRDPWELPKTYAEDLYTGGPVREADRSKSSPSHLTPAAEKANYFANNDPQPRPSSVLISQPTDHDLAEVLQASATPTLILPTIDEFSNGDDEASLYDEDVLELDTPTTAALRDEPDFISFTALNQPSDVESERGGPETLYISDNDGGEVSEDGEEVEEEDEFDGDGPIPLGTSDLEIPAEHELGEDGGEELDELEDDDEPVAEITTNPPYGYYGLDASSVTGSGGLDDETRTVGPPSDPPKGDQSEASGVVVSQEYASLLDPPPLPAAAAFIEIDHQLQSAASVVVGDTTRVSPTSLDGTPTIPGEVAAGDENADSVDEGSVGDDTILADEAVLTVNEIEDVLRDAFAEADQLVSITIVQGGNASVTDTTPSIEESVTRTPPRSNSRVATSEAFSGGGPLPNGPAIKEDEDNPAEQSPSTAKDKPSNSQEAQQKPPSFIMPLIANPNVRDPMSTPWSPVQSGPSTPVASLTYLPAVAKFKRDNQLLGTVHTSSGLFTPLEGSNSSSPSPSDTTTPEDRPDAEVETKVPVVEDDEQHIEEQVTLVLASPTDGSPEVPEVEPETVPTGPPGDGWEEIPRLPTPPAEVLDHVEGALPTGPVSRVFFQPESNNDVESLDVRSEADRGDRTKDSDALPVDTVATPREGNEDPPGLNNAEPLVHAVGDTKDLPEVVEMDDPFKLMGSDSTVAPGAVANDNESSIASSSPDEEMTPRLKLSEIPAPMAEDSQAAESIHPEIQSPMVRAQGGAAIPTETRRNLRKRRRSESVPTDLEPSGSGRTANGEVSNVLATSLRNGGYKEVGHEPTDDVPRIQREEHDSDNESFASSIFGPRNADPSSQEGSRMSPVVPERPPLPQGQSPVPEDAPVFHGHGKFKAALQDLKLLRRTSEQTHSQDAERETKRAKEKEKPAAVKMETRKSSENGSRGNTEAKKPPPLILPEVSTQPSLPSASTSQSPRTPTSALPPSSPTVVTAPAEVTPPPHRELTTQEPAKPDNEAIRKPAVKAVKRTTSRKYVPVEPKSTRSQCRYRKISLPREENGPRVTFCVPQCSLNNKQLMKEEDITDDGLATVRDFERLWDHVEEQDLSPYLIGIIRQLVGLDLLRENEIYYLPTNEEIKQVERRQKREERRKSRKSIGGAVDVEGTSLAGRSGSVLAPGPVSQPSLVQVEKGKLGPPPSFPESISTTTSTRSGVGRGGSARSISEDEMSDGKRGGRASKRRRRAVQERDGDGSSRRNTPSIREDSAAPSAGSPAPSQSTTESTPVRRSQRTLRKAISADAQAYKPPVSSGGESSENELENTKARRKSAKGGMKGLKRRRAEDAGDSPVLPATGGAGERDAPLSPRSTRSKRVKIDEK